MRLNGFGEINHTILKYIIINLYRYNKMNAKKMYKTTLVWYHRNEKMPLDGNRILVYSSEYSHKDPFKVRIIDSQFYKISTDAEWWAYINLPL